MRKRTIIVYWLLLLVPTALIAIGAIRLLRIEREMHAERAMSAARLKAGAIADRLELAVTAIQDELLDTIPELAGGGTTDALLKWERDNPLIRNVFAWDPAVGLIYPSPEGGATAEERQFAVRFESLFSGRLAFKDAAAVAPGEQSARQAANAPAQTTQSTSSQVESYGRRSLRQKIAQIRSPVRQYKQIAKGYQKGQVSENSLDDATERGWIPWFSENRLHLLGWIEDPSDGRVYGIELEVMMLLARLIETFPVSVPEGATVALIDGTGRVMHQVGGLELDPAARPGESVTLSPVLPHWRVEMFSATGFASDAGSGFVLLSSLLLLVFVAAILIGGALLMRQAHLNMIDARQKTTFVSNVSHELKTPLTSIRMYAELLHEGRVKDETKKHQYLHVIAAESQRLTRLVNNVLDFSRLEQGRKNYQVQALELNAFLDQFLATHRDRIEAAGLVLSSDMPDRDCVVRFDRDALEQVLLNLVDNAVKYAASGKVLDVRLEALPQKCRLSIMDRGPGIPGGQRERIFEKFHRIDNTLTTEQPGSGLGLSIARSLVEDLGGQLYHQSRQGGGSVFTIELTAKHQDGVSLEESS